MEFLTIASRVLSAEGILQSVVPSFRLCLEFELLYRKKLKKKKKITGKFFSQANYQTAGTRDQNATAFYAIT